MEHRSTFAVRHAPRMVARNKSSRVSHRRNLSDKGKYLLCDGGFFGTNDCDGPRIFKTSSFAPCFDAEHVKSRGFGICSDQSQSIDDGMSTSSDFTDFSSDVSSCDFPTQSYRQGKGYPCIDILMKPNEDAKKRSCSILSDCKGRFYFVDDYSGASLLVAEKRRDGLKRLKTTSNFRIFLPESNSSESGIMMQYQKKVRSKSGKTVVGKIRGNINGSAFVVYDGGVRLKDAAGAMVARRELARITFNRIPRSQGRRQVTALIPNGFATTGLPLPDRSLSMRFEKNHPAVEVFRNTTDEIQRDFGEIEPGDMMLESNDGRIPIALKRTGECSWLCEFMGPISAFQAFCLCVASLENDYS